MRKSKTPLRGSVTQNVSSRVRTSERDGIGFLARLGLLIAFVLGLLVVGVVGWHSGWPQRKVEQAQDAALNLTGKAHFKVKDIIVKGRQQSSKDDIFDALAIKQGSPILGIDALAAAERLSKLPWVEKVSVQRRLPDAVIVFLTERKPMARWQQNDRTYVIDKEGQVLPSAKAEDFPELPLVVGVGAEREAQALYTLLKNYPDIREKTNAAVRVGERRWDLHFYPKIVVRLPEENVENALLRLSVLMAEEKILSRDIVAVDLRIEDRLTIEPAPSAKTGELKK